MKRALLGGLVVASLMASAAPKMGSGLAPMARPAAAQTEEPVGRFMIRYKTRTQLAGQAAGATPATERVVPAAQVSRSASIAGIESLKYLKSVSDQLHVVTLAQKTTPAQAQALMQRLRADPAVDVVMIDERVQPHFVPNDPSFASAAQWHLQSSRLVVGAINAAEAWDFSRGTGVVVAVLDGGFRPHADLVSNILTGYDFISADNASDYGGDTYWTANDGNARDIDARDPGDWVTSADVSAGYCDQVSASSWHGTHVAGLLAAVGNNGAGGLGVAFGSKLLPVRVLGRCGGYMSDILAGARWAAGLAVPGAPTNPTPARVLNLSLGVDGPCDVAAQSVVDEIRARNVSIVASSGNNADTSISKPANCQGVFGVTAHNRSGYNASYANVGTNVAISAPGGEADGLMLSTWNLGQQRPGADAYGSMAGTSMAAPMVSGVLALLSALRPDLPMSTLEGFVKTSARPFPINDYCTTNPDGLPPGFCGSGLLDAAAAVEAARPAGPDLAVTQDMLSGLPVIGYVSRFTTTVRNLGLETATLVQLTASVSADLSIESASALPTNASVTFSAGALGASLGSLAPGQALTITVAARVVGTTSGLTSTAESSTSSPEASTANNRDVLLLAGPVAPVFEPESFADSATSADSGGGGCTVAPNGQADAGLLVLLVLAAALARWRRPALQDVRPTSAS